MPFKAYYLDPAGRLHQDLDEAQIAAAQASGEGLLWVDIGETTQADGQFLERVFQFHHLSIEDCLDATVSTPKVDEFEDYLFMVFHGINYTAATEIIRTTELDLFLGENFLVTNHNVFLYSIEAIKRLVELDGRPMRRGVDFLAHAVIDALVDNIKPVIDQLGDRADAIEEIIFQSNHTSTLQAILHLKRSTLRLRRAMLPQREVLTRLSRREFTHISDEASRYYRNIYDDLARMEGFIENMRDRLDTILATYMSVVANQQNESIKSLSVIAAIFLPLTLLAGIYGMNFEYMPELEYRYAYFIVLGFMVMVAGGVMWYYWARRWILAGRKRLAKFVPAAVDPERLISYVGHMARWTHLHGPN
jgi:magnesium transporter